MVIFRHQTTARAGDVLFSREDGVVCAGCGWGAWWASGGDFRRATCERCGMAARHTR